MNIRLHLALCASASACAPTYIDEDRNRRDNDQQQGDGDGEGVKEDEVDEPLPCGAPDATVFDVYVDDVLVLPYDEYGQPWDWDGQIPQDLLDSVDLLSWVIQDLISAGLYPPDPTALTVAELVAISAEVLDAVDTYAPALLADTVPPDLYVDLLLEDANADWWTFGTSDYVSDNFHARVNTVWPEMELYRGDSVYFDVWDKDLISDDELGALWFDLAAARDFADCGPQSWVSGDAFDPIQVVRFEIVAVE